MLLHQGFLAGTHNRCLNGRLHVSSVHKRRHFSGNKMTLLDAYFMFSLIALESMLFLSSCSYWEHDYHAIGSLCWPVLDSISWIQKARFLSVEGKLKYYAQLLYWKGNFHLPFNVHPRGKKWPWPTFSRFQHPRHLEGKMELSWDLNDLQNQSSAASRDCLSASSLVHVSKTTFHFSQFTVWDPSVTEP